MAHESVGLLSLKSEGRSANGRLKAELEVASSLLLDLSLFTTHSGRTTCSHLKKKIYLHGNIKTSV